MKYYKRIKDDSFKRIEVGKIYPENYQIKDAFVQYNTVAGSANARFGKGNWQQVTFADYAKQEGWYIKGSDEFEKWCFVNEADVQGGVYPYYYPIDNQKIAGYKYYFDYGREEPKGIEVTVDQLNELLNNNDMEQFQVKVTPTTSRILQELAFENGYTWSAGRTKYIIHTSKYLMFSNGTNITHTDEIGALLVSLDEAIVRIESKPEPIHIGRYEVKFNGSAVKVGCKTFDIGIIKALYSNMDELHIEAVEVAEVPELIHHETIKQIIERYEKQS